MADWEAAAIVTLGVAIIGLIINENHRIRKRNEEVIDDIYPNLVADIKESMHNYEVHYNNPNTSFNNFLELRNLRKNDKINKIEEVNKKTYEYLTKVEKCIIPKLDDVDKMKKIVYNKILDKWIKYVEQLPNKDYAHKDIVNELHSETYLLFLKDDFRDIELAYNNLMTKTIQSIPNYNIFPHGTVDELIKIVKENVKELKELDKKIRQLFTSIIEEKLLPEMKKDSNNTVK